VSGSTTQKWNALRAGNEPRVSQKLEGMMAETAFESWREVSRERAQMIGKAKEPKEINELKERRRKGDCREFFAGLELQHHRKKRKERN
jgi:uncharacterized protein with WD repeat